MFGKRQVETPTEPPTPSEPHAASTVEELERLAAEADAEVERRRHALEDARKREAAAAAERTRRAEEARTEKLGGLVRARAHDLDAIGKETNRLTERARAALRAAAADVAQLGKLQRRAEDLLAGLSPEEVRLLVEGDREAAGKLALFGTAADPAKDPEGTAALSVAREKWVPAYFAPVPGGAPLPSEAEYFNALGGGYLQYHHPSAPILRAGALPLVLKALASPAE